MPNNTEVISCDLFSILSSLNFSVEDITGLTPAKFRKGAFLHAKISASQATRAADISLQLLTDRVSGEMNYVIVIGRHEGLLQSEAIDPNADKQYRGQVPSAGVGTCFSRRAVTALLADGDGIAFDVQSLTEDYDIGFRLKEKGMTEIFVRFPDR